MYQRILKKGKITITLIRRVYIFFTKIKVCIISNNYRLLERKAFNNSAPSLSGGGKGPTREDEGSHLFKAHPVPSHVYKPLYDFIMLKNQRRY